MRDKILKSKCLHINLSNQATEIQCDVTISGPEDFKNEHGVKCTGVWDTGSEGCLISPALSKKLNLVIISYKIVVGVTGEQMSPEFLVNLFLSNGDSFEGISTLVGNKLVDDEFIIGMSIINKGDFAITNVNKKTTMSFRSPSVARINFVTEYEKARKEEEEINRRQNKATKRTQKRRKKNNLKTNSFFFYLYSDSSNMYIFVVLKNHTFKNKNNHEKETKKISDLFACTFYYKLRL